MTGFFHSLEIYLDQIELCLVCNYSRGDWNLDIESRNPDRIYEKFRNRSLSNPLCPGIHSLVDTEELFYIKTMTRSVQRTKSIAIRNISLSNPEVFWCRLFC